MPLQRLLRQLTLLLTDSFKAQESRFFFVKTLVKVLLKHQLLKQHLKEVNSNVWEINFPGEETKNRQEKNKKRTTLVLHRPFAVQGSAITQKEQKQRA